MSYETITAEFVEPVATVRLNRPERRNALSLLCMRELIDALSRIEHNSGIRAAILASSGPVFSSGHDLSELRDRSSGDYREIFNVCTELMLKVQSIPQPVIAEVQGLATAAGCQLVASCDLAVASFDAAFATPGVKIGLFCTTPMVALTRAIGRKRALEMLLTGASVDARTAAEWGLINRAVPPGELEMESRKLAMKCTESSALTCALGKQAFYEQIDLNQAQAYSFAKEVMTSNALTDDAQEGISAFLEKRSPCWKGR